MKAYKLIRGKFDSHWKFDFNLKTGERINRKMRGHFMTAMQYACYTKGGMIMIEGVRSRPWNTWKAY